MKIKLEMEYCEIMTLVDLLTNERSRMRAVMYADNATSGVKSALEYETAKYDKLRRLLKQHLKEYGQRAYEAGQLDHELTKQAKQAWHEYYEAGEY